MVMPLVGVESDDESKSVVRSDRGTRENDDVE
jgi:hypothetical protein